MDFPRGVLVLQSRRGDDDGVPTKVWAGNVIIDVQGLCRWIVGDGALGDEHLRPVLGSERKSAEEFTQQHNFKSFQLGGGSQRFNVFKDLAVQIPDEVQGAWIVQEGTRSEEHTS